MKIAPNSSNKVSISLQEFPHCVFLFHRAVLTNNANLRVASVSVNCSHVLMLSLGSHIFK